MLAAAARARSPRSLLTCRIGSITTDEAPRKPFDILLFGSDNFSIATLKEVHAAKDVWSSITVITPPDARTGRGLKQIRQAPLKIHATSLSLPILSPTSSELATFTPPTPSTLLLTASYGSLLPSQLLARYAPLHALNAHPSLLPQLRGAAPIQWAIARGLRRTGVSVQGMSVGKFDRGEVLAQVGADVPDGATYHELEAQLGLLSGKLVVSVLRDFEAHKRNAQPQNPTHATHAPKIRPQTAQISFSRQSAIEITRLHCAIAHQQPLLAPLLPTATPTQLLSVTLHSSDPPSALADAPPGSAVLDPSGDAVVIRCGGEQGGAVRIGRLKARGKKEVGARDWWNGYNAKGKGGDLGVLRFGEWEDAEGK